MLKDISFKIVYLLFLFFIITGSNLYFAGITFKYVLTLLLFVWVILKDKGFMPDKCIKLYLGFILVFFLSALLTGQTSSFINTFFRYYFPAYIGLRATHICLKDDFSFAKIILLLLLSMGLLDAAVTFSQFTLNAGWYEPIRELFQFAVDEDFEDFVSTRSWLTTKSLAYGIFASAAMNGYYLCLFCILSTYPYLKTKKVWLLFLPFLFLVGLFVCQERSPLYLSVLLLGYIVFKTMPSLSTISKFILVFGAIILITYGFERVVDLSEKFEMRFTERVFDDTGRGDIQSGVWEYLGTNPMFPNFNDLLANGYRAPHNLFLNALVYGGPISFILIMSILLIQSKRAWAILKNMNKGGNYILVAFTMGWIIFTANSLVHNRSVVTGELILWVLWAIMSHEHTIDNKSYNHEYMHNKPGISAGK